VNTNEQVVPWQIKAAGEQHKFVQGFIF